MSGAKNAEHGPGLRRYKPYPAYKDSGVEWLGEIPETWQALKLKRVCSFAYGDSLAADARLDGDIQVYGSNGPVGSHDRANTLEPCLVIGRKGSFGKVNFSSRPVFAIDTTFFVDCRFTQADIRWLYYVLSNASLDSASKDSAIPGLDREDAYAREVCACSEPEQHAIAAFLDRETARIDALVAKKERLIELLQEKRTAVITRAVTKGLDPNAPMKDSGVEWLGEIPVHWDVKRICDVAEALQTGPFGSQLHANEYVLGGYPVINPVNLCDGRLVPDDECTINDAAAERLAHHRLQEGDILFARRGELGRCGVVTNQEAGWLCGTGCLRLRVRRDAARPSFLIRLLSTSGVADWLGLQSVGATMQNLNTSIIGRIPFAVPPTAEQEAIAVVLDRETAKLDALVAKVREAIERLKELRTALISAAVTGKIDVREEVA